MKYRQFIEILKDNVIYTPATVTDNGIAQGLISGDLAQEEPEKIRTKIRHSLARFTLNHRFPKGGDGWVDIEGQPPIRGWYGKRWKRALT